MDRCGISFVLFLFGLLFLTSASGEELLLNAGFEDGTGEPLNPYGISSWVGYGNQERSVAYSRTGAASLKMFGGVGNSGLYQVVPLEPGGRIHASGFFFSPLDDNIGGTARTCLRIEFLGSAPNRVEAMPVNSVVPPDTWQDLTINIPSSSTTGVGRFVLIWADGDEPGGSVFWDSVLTARQADPATNLLANAGFEEGEGGPGNPYGIAKWIAFGNAELSQEAAYGGTGALKLFGGLGYSGAFQGFRYTPQDALTVSAMSMTASSDPISGTATSGLIVEWADPIIDTAELPAADASSPTDQWLLVTFIAYPPPGAIAARLVISFDDGDAPAGAVYVDDASLLQVFPGDTNGDRRIDGRDIDGFKNSLLLPDSVPAHVRAAADIGGSSDYCTPDGAVTMDDLPGFLLLLTESSCE